MSSKKTKPKQKRRPLAQTTRKTFVPRYPVTSLTPLRDQIRNNILVPTQYREYSHVNPTKSQNTKKEVFEPVVAREEETKSDVPPLQPRRLQLETPQQRSPYMLRPRRPTTYQDRSEVIIL